MKIYKNMRQMGKAALGLALTAGFFVAGQASVSADASIACGGTDDRLTIQTAVDAGGTVTLSGDCVLSDAPGQIVINDDVIINGPATIKTTILPDGTTIGRAVNPIFLINSGDVEINDLVITTDISTANVAPTAIGVTGGDVKINNLTTDNLLGGNGTITGSQVGFGIIANGSSVLSISNSNISGFNKGAIYLYDSVQADLSGVTINGAGALDFPAQNGIVVINPSGMKLNINDITINDLDYRGDDFITDGVTATGIMIYATDPDSVEVTGLKNIAINMADDQSAIYELYRDEEESGDASIVSKFAQMNEEEPDDSDGSDEPTPTPAPAPVPVPVVTRSSRRANGPTTQARPTGCDDMAPIGMPDLFQIERLNNGRSVVLSWTPVDQASGYFIAYGEKGQPAHYGVKVDYSTKDGVNQFQINDLNPAQEYFFEMRGQNGCMPGDWGNRLSALGGAAGRIFYK